MREFESERASSPWRNRKRLAAIGFGLGATLALSPFVWAEDPPAAGSPPQATQTTPPTMTSPIALIQHQSLAPLVKKVSPAVVNISVSRSAASGAISFSTPDRFCPSAAWCTAKTLRTRGARWAAGRSATRSIRKSRAMTQCDIGSIRRTACMSPDKIDILSAHTFFVRTSPEADRMSPMPHSWSRPMRAEQVLVARWRSIA